MTQKVIRGPFNVVFLIIETALMRSVETLSLRPGPRESGASAVAEGDRCLG